MPDNPSEPKGKRLTAALAVFAWVVVPLAIYVAGYLWLPRVGFTYVEDLGKPEPELAPKLTEINRQFPQQWMATVFGPAAKVEGWLRGIDVQASSSWRIQRRLADPYDYETFP